MMSAGAAEWEAVDHPTGPMRWGVAMASAVLDVILPLFGIMLTGSVAGRCGIVTGAGSVTLSRFVFFVAFPALVFVSLSRVPVAEVFDWPFLGALGGGMLATMCLGFAVARLAFPDSLTALGLHGLTAMYSSTAYIGLPLILIGFGDEALVPGIVGAVITGTVFLPIAILLAEIDRGRGTARVVRQPLVALARNPVLLATTAGLAVSAVGVALPRPAVTLLELLGGAFVPCALFSAGLFMAVGAAKSNVREVGWLVFAKLILHPALTWVLARHVFGLEGTLAAIVVLQAALPSGVPVFILAQHYGVFVARSNMAIVVSTVLSVVTLSGLLLVLGP
jgi:malonate transporter